MYQLYQKDQDQIRDASYISDVVFFLLKHFRAMEEDKKRRRLDPALQELKAAQDAKVPIVWLLASPDSYPFQEKVLRVTDTLNIGRSNLADIKNGLFECPQLSATHATINYKKKTN